MKNVFIRSPLSTRRD
jgi:1,4-alpha-glucan branching enzyme